MCSSDLTGAGCQWSADTGRRFAGSGSGRERCWSGTECADGLFADFFRCGGLLWLGANSARFALGAGVSRYVCGDREFGFG